MSLKIGVKVANKVVPEPYPVETERFGVKISNLLGIVDEDGKYVSPTESIFVDMSSVREIGPNAMKYIFAYNNLITSVDLSSLTTVSQYGLQYAFDGCENLTSVDLSSLTHQKAAFGFYGTFRKCKGLTSVDLSSLVSIDTTQGFDSTFDGCTNLITANLSSLVSVGTVGMNGTFSDCANLTYVDLSSLQIIASSAMRTTFKNCKKLKKILFPALTSVDRGSFGDASYNYIFYGCGTTLEEIHFRADAQATIEVMTGYSNKWGATNATIYFDL